MQDYRCGNKDKHLDLNSRPISTEVAHMSCGLVSLIKSDTVIKSAVSLIFKALIRNDTCCQSQFHLG